MREKKERDRLKTLEWLAEFVMCTEDSIPIGWQQRLIRALLAKDPEAQGVNIEAVNVPSGLETMSEHERTASEQERESWHRTA